MYGLVNKGLQDFVYAQFGHKVWDEIKDVAMVQLDSFVSMRSYPDELSLKLIQATAQVLGFTQEQVLESFGEYWVLYTAQVGYGPLLDMAGTNFQEFLVNLDSLHARVGLAFTDLKPPSFECTNISEHSLHLHYYSVRSGLSPMVIGLLKGLGKRFAIPIKISVLEIDRKTKPQASSGSQSHQSSFLVEY